MGFCQQAEPQLLLFRADADIGMGTGHVMRCLALAEAWMEEGGRAMFVCSSLPAPLAERIRLAGADLLFLPGSDAVDAEALIEVARETGPHCVVVDGYQFYAEFESSVAGEFPVLWIDDYAHANVCSSRWILNQNLYACEDMYPGCGSGVRHLLGPDYALLRREFWETGLRRTSWRASAHKVLVSLGGADPANATCKVLDLFARIPAPCLKITVLVGAANPHLDEIQRRQNTAPHVVTVLSNVRAVRSLMADSDLAVCAGGTTALEVLRTGLPCAMLVLADNQERVTASFAERGLALNLGRDTNMSSEANESLLTELILDHERRREMGMAGQSVVDGAGCFRVLNELGLDRIHFREAKKDDVDLIYRWANDPDVRRASFRSDPIPRVDHEAWYAARLADPGALLWIATNTSAIPIGIARFALEVDRAIISVALDPAARGRKYGVVLIREASKRLLGRGIPRIDAFIRPTNSASLRAFHDAGYVQVESTTVSGQAALCYSFYPSARSLP